MHWTQRWGEFVIRRGIALTAVVLAVGALALVPIPRADGHLVGSDGAYYYCYLHSLVLDGDLDITNDVEAYNARVPANSPARIRPAYVFSIGPALLWTPAFVLARLGVLGAHRGGIAVATDGFSMIEEAAVGFASLAAMIAGLVLLARTVRRWTSATAATSATLIVFWASSAVYYALFEPSMAHALEFFTVALLLAALPARSSEARVATSHTLRGTSGNRRWVAVGAALGLAVLVRWQNIVFGIVVLYLALRSVPQLNRSRSEGARQGRAVSVGMAPLGSSPTILHQLVSLGSFTIGFFLVAALQCLAWKLMLGTWFTVPQGAGFFTAPHVLQVLFSTRHGWFTWTPVALLGCAGLAWLRDRGLALALAAAIAADVMVCAIAGDWWGGDAFGMRRLIGSLPLVTIGLAALLDRLTAATRPQTSVASPRTALAAIFAILFIAWNAAFMVQYRLGRIPAGDALSLRQLVADKILLPFAMLRHEPTAPSGEYVALNGIRMYYEVHGTGTPLMLLHGGAGNGMQFEKQLPDFVPRYRCIVPDLCGQGRSTDRPAPLTYHAMAEDVVALLDHLHVDSADLMGWSDGGIIGLDIAIHHPERLRHLVTFGANFAPDGLNAADIRWNQTATADSFGPGMRSGYQQLSPEPANYEQVMNKIIALWREQPNFTLDELRSIRTPTLIAAGEHDVVRTDHTEALAAAIPGARLWVVPGASHSAMQEQPALVNKTVLEFLGAR